MDFFMTNIFRKLVLVTIIALVSYSSIGGCGGDPTFAPFGSEVEILTEEIDISIPPNTLEVQRVQAIVTRDDEFTGETIPLNDVVVRWDLSFAGLNSIVVDTDGDGIADARGLQFVNPQGCGQQECTLVPISQWFSLGAFVDSPFETLTDNRGIADILILISGDSNVAEATLSASTESGSVDTLEITLGEQ